jgi:hypothetical protein
MGKLPWSAGISVVCLVACALVFIGIDRVNSQPPVEKTEPEPAPPEGQTYTGAKRCSACHFKQYMTWKKTKHATEAFTGMAKNYQVDPKCLICHATGFGQPTGFTDAVKTPALAGVTCEACHGPGSEHEKVCQQYANVKQLSPEQNKAARDSIWKVMPGNICSRCHVAQSHGEHPPYTK